MQTEEASHRSFFDDEVPTTKFAFQSPNDSHQKHLNLPPMIRETLTVKSNQDNTSKQCSLGLQNSLIVQFINDKNTIPDLVLDVLHARLEPLKSTENDPKYGFTIAKNGTVFEFICPSKKSMEDWIEALKKACVLGSFHDDYKAVKMIGRGSFAKVYLVESKATRKSYAVKAFTKDCMAVSNKACAKPSLLNEIEIMRGINHENIIKLYEIYETDKSIYLVLELIQGTSLYDFLKKPNFKKEISLTQVQNIIRSLLDALAYLASKGIMHRDLKPDNILLEKGEKVKLVDFGLATFIHVPAYIFKKCGTPGYIAPEVFKYNDKCPNTDYDDHCDVFSVGCLLHYMLFNAPFFQAGSAGDILKLNKNYNPEYPGLEKIKHEIGNPCGSVNKEGLTLLLDLVEYDLKKRISANQALIHPFLNHPINGVQRLGSSTELASGISKYAQGEVKSPNSPLNHSPLTPSQTYSPLKPLKIDAGNKENSILLNQDRFVKEDSLYLDLGRPEMNGRTDTVVAGSTTNSLLLVNRGDSSSNISPTCPPSAFSKKEARNSSNKKLYSAKSYNQGASQSFLKAAIFNNMQKNNSEGIKDDEGPKSTSDELRMSRSTSGFAVYGVDSKGEDEEADDVSDEDAGVHHHIEKINRKNSGMHPSKISHSKMGRFQPTSAGAQLARKSTAESDL